MSEYWREYERRVNREITEEWVTGSSTVGSELDEPNLVEIIIQSEEGKGSSDRDSQVWDDWSFLVTSGDWRDLTADEYYRWLHAWPKRKRSKTALSRPEDSR